MRKLLVFLLILLGFSNAFSLDSLHLANQANDKSSIASEPLTTYSTLWGWLGNTRMELGDGTNLLYREMPIQISTDNWIMVVVGYSHSLGIKSDSTLWAWGENNNGSYGNGTNISSNIPIQISSEKHWKFVSAGVWSSYAIKSDGSLWAWGYNFWGDLGDSTEKNNRYTSVQIGKGVLGKVKYISISNRVSFAINEDGCLFAWGLNSWGQLGDGTTERKNYPIRIGDSCDWSIISGDGLHSVAIKKNGTLWAWGINDEGQLGDSTYIDKIKPIQIGRDSDWVDISSESTTNLAVKMNGTLWCWGKFLHSVANDTIVRKNYPTQIGKDKDWIMARGKNLLCEALKKDGSFWVWGLIRNWETLQNDTILVPTQMDNITNVAQLFRSFGNPSFFLRNYIAKKAKISTLPVGNATSNSAEVGGKILSTEGEKIYQRGFCYDFDFDPTIMRDTTRNGTDLGEYHTTLTNLLPFTKYYVRAYVTTAAGESYGETERIFTKLATPVLVSPQQSAIDIPLKSDFIWKKDLNAIKYRIQLSEFANFSSSVFDEEVTDTVFSYSDLELHYDYFWRIQTINGAYLSDWSEVNSFHTIKFNTQQLLSPIEKAINIPIDFQLKWSENTKSSSYILQVSNDLGYNNFVIDTILTENSFSFSKLDYLQSYFWRVRSFIGVDSSGWSPVWRFTTLMDSIRLNSPEDLSSNLGLTQNLSWAKGIYDKKYRLQVAKDNDFSNMIFDTLLNQKYDADINNLKNYTKYFWRVRNQSGDTLGYWSQIWQFKTRMSDVQLIYPENDKTGLAQKIKFIWSAVFGAEFYQLQISKNAQFTDIVYSKDSIKTTEHNVPDLELNSLYYRRVRPWNAESKGTIYWSEVWSFRTGNVGVKDESEYIKIIPNPAGDFITIALKPSEGSEIQIYNTLGEKVMSESIHPMTASHRMNITDLPKGIYFVKAGGETAKFVKL